MNSKNIFLVIFLLTSFLSCSCSTNETGKIKASICSYDLVDLLEFGCDKLRSPLVLRLKDTEIETELKKRSKAIVDIISNEDIVNLIEIFCYGSTVEKILRNVKESKIEENILVLGRMEKDKFDIRYLNDPKICLAFISSNYYKTPEFYNYTSINHEYELNLTHKFEEIEKGISRRSIGDEQKDQVYIDSYRLEGGGILLNLTELKNNSMGTLCIQTNNRMQINKLNCSKNNCVLYPRVPNLNCSTLNDIIACPSIKNTILLYPTFLIYHKRNKEGDLDIESIKSFNKNKELENSIFKIAVVYDFCIPTNNKTKNCEITFSNKINRIYIKELTRLRDKLKYQAINFKNRLYVKYLINYGIFKYRLRSLKTKESISGNIFILSIIMAILYGLNNYANISINYSFSTAVILIIFGILNFIPGILGLEDIDFRQYYFR